MLEGKKIALSDSYMKISSAILYSMSISIFFLYILKQIIDIWFRDYSYAIIATLLFLVLIIFIVSQKFKISKTLNIYTLIFILIILISFLFKKEYNIGYVEGLFIYFIQPVILVFAFQNLTYKQSLHLCWLISRAVLISFVGMIAYYMYLFYGIGYWFQDPGEEHALFELTNVGDTLGIRNISIYGNSLVAAGIGLVHLSATLIYAEIKKDKFSHVCIILAFIFIFLTMSRRAEVPAVIIVALYIFRSEIKIRNFIFLASAILIAYVAFFDQSASFVFDRFFSTFSMSSVSDGNRINASYNGILHALDQPFGTGFGTLSSIGKTVENINDAKGFLGVSESFIIMFIGETGIVFLPCWVLLLFLIYRNSNEFTRYYLLLPFLIESIYGLTLANPTSNYFYFLLFMAASKLTCERKPDSLLYAPKKL